MKIIFLDINGVMSTSGYKKVYNAKDYPIQLNESAVKALNFLLIETNAKIVITSTYKRTYSVREIHRMFIEQGVVNCLMEVTGNCHFKKEEIKEYIEQNVFNNIESFLILDDEMISGFDDNFLLIDGSLSINDANICLNILNHELLTGMRYSDFKDNLKETVKNPFANSDWDNDKKNRIKRTPLVNSESKQSRNDLCLCGSGKKYKKCCINK